MKKISSFPFLTFVVFLFISIPFDALAYLDPGTGSYIMQIIIAAAVGGAFAVKMFWLNLKIFFYNLFHKEKMTKENSIKKDDTE